MLQPSVTHLSAICYQLILCFAGMLSPTFLVEIPFKLGNQVKCHFLHLIFSSSGRKWFSQPLLLTSGYTFSPISIKFLELLVNDFSLCDSDVTHTCLGNPETKEKSPWWCSMFNFLEPPVVKLENCNAIFPVSCKLGCIAPVVLEDIHKKTCHQEKI